MKLLKVISPGPRTTVQDAGRRHYQKHGLAQAGPADRVAFLWANKLLDNPLGAACLEITLGGLEVEALAGLTIALTGADAQPRVNGRPVSNWHTLHLSAGDRLSLTTASCGRYSYLAVGGGFRSPVLFGSQSVVVREQFDALQPLQAGDELAGSDRGYSPDRVVPASAQPDYGLHLPLRLIAGYQYEQFSRADLTRLLTSDYRISAQSDRMGYKLEGAALQTPPPGIVSEGIALGSVQVPGDGVPIVLLQDRQTVGGYPKLGTVCAIDCYRLAQRQPGQTVRFELTDLATAQNERALLERQFRQTTWTPAGDELRWSD
ncbi:MAG: biotin-dependent carboxyltransferase family protein [Marinobacter sp.]|uniref:5-oxoprolinase subunit C family protein n=1 Tax=Marinobacter sp. TaxID=50741 RepID=UPI00299D90FF|nr:biotin-dependent carboxyltransferase family protein [Marinobacter sp.]MDX1755000.1 biotin-dependent carboxyltransferase family protein [Marinobacter sp.]